ncbi:MAG TPA: hypothetical protein VEQ60_26820 [Longimicrobium sp.]|nr:hypothetical protein [Longimicrobium sp.]
MPVLLALRNSGRYDLRVAAYRHALAAWSAAGLDPEPLDEGMDDAGAARLLAGADLLLCATSHNGVDLEKRLIAAARGVGIPSLAVLDFWSSYALRFADADGRRAFVPDRVAVPDETARTGMLEAGFDPARLVVTGQPAFDALAAVRAGFTPERREEVRAALGVRPGERMVLFLSQPLRAVFGAEEGSPHFPGYTEDGVLARLAAALEAAARRRGERVALVVRPHPREDPASFVLPPPGAVRTLVSAEGDGREAALAAELVAGMHTVLLVEASLLGCVVLSLQPGLRGADPLPTNRDGRSLAVYDADAIPAAVERALWDEAARAEVRARGAGAGAAAGGAAARVIEVLDSLLAPG